MIFKKKSPYSEMDTGPVLSVRVITSELESNIQIQSKSNFSLTAVSNASNAEGFAKPKYTNVRENIDQGKQLGGLSKNLTTNESTSKKHLNHADRIYSTSITNSIKNNIERCKFGKSESCRNKTSPNENIANETVTITRQLAVTATTSDDPASSKGEPVTAARRSRSGASWLSGATYQLTVVSVLCSLGTVWRFPAAAMENHAGSFVFAYLVIWLLIGLPVLILEQSVGQFSSKGIWKIWSCVPVLRGLAICQCFTSIYFIAMSGILMSWTGLYFVATCTTDSSLGWNASLTSDCRVNMLDWITCRNVSSAEYYFSSSILRLTPMTDITSLDWKTLVGAAIAVLLLTCICWRGILLFQFVSILILILIFGLFLALLIYIFCQSGGGAKDGIVYFFTPQWDHMQSQVWYGALTQVIYTHQIGLGVNISLSNYNAFRWPILEFSIISSVTATVSSLFIGAVIFALIGNMAEEMDVSMDDAVGLDYGVLYIAVSYAVASIKVHNQIYGGVVFGILFFAFVMTMGSHVINITTMVGGRFNRVFKHQWQAVIPTAAVGYCACVVFGTDAGFYFLRIVDVYGVSIPAIVCVVLETIGFLWIYGSRSLRTDIGMMTNRAHFANVVQACVVTPVLILVIVIAACVQFSWVTLDGLVIPDWGHGLGLALTLVAVLPILVCGVYVTCSRLGYGTVEKWRMAIKPSVSWGPEELDHRQEWLSRKVESWAQQNEALALALNNTLTATSKTPENY